MRNEIEDLKQQAVEQAKQQLKNMAKESAKKVGKQIWEAIAPALPYIIIGLIILIIIVGCVDWDVVTASASTQGMTNASSNSWEQFKRFVLINEGGTRVDENGKVNPNGAYYIVENDSQNNPTIGHGLCLKHNGSYLNVEVFSKHGIDSKKMADNYFKGIYDKVSVEICDAIWNELLYAKYESVVSTCQGLGLKEYQLFALTDVKYRRGNIDGFIDKYNRLWDASQDSYKKDTSSEVYSMDTLYSFFNNGFTDTSSGVYARKKRQWVLFKYGYYQILDEYWTESIGTTDYTFNEGDYIILENAVRIQQTANNNGYDQNSSGYTDACLGFAFAYAHSINTNTTDRITGSISEAVKGNWSSDTYRAGYTSENKNEILGIVYDELTKGKACIIQVVGSFFDDNPAKPKTRHFVTAIGYRKGVNRSNIQDTDILIIDTWDSKIEKLVPEYTSGGRYLLKANSSPNYNYPYQMYTCN